MNKNLKLARALTYWTVEGNRVLVHRDGLGGRFIGSITKGDEGRPIHIAESDLRAGIKHDLITDVEILASFTPTLEALVGDATVFRASPSNGADVVVTGVLGPSWWTFVEQGMGSNRTLPWLDLRVAESHLNLNTVIVFEAVEQ